MIKNKLIKVNQQKPVANFLNNEQNKQKKRNTIPKQLEWLLSKQSTTTSLLLDGNQKQSKKHIRSNTRQILQVKKRQINKHSKFSGNNRISYQYNTTEVNNPQYLLIDIKNSVKSKIIKARRTKTTSLIKNPKENNLIKDQKSSFDKLKQQQPNLYLSAQKHVTTKPIPSFNGLKQKLLPFYSRQLKNVTVQNKFSESFITTKIPFDQQIKDQISILKNTQSLIRKNRPITSGERVYCNRKLFASVYKNSLFQSFEINPWQNKTNLIEDQEL